MLTHIQVTNLVTIEELQLDFSPNTTVITGETGAGKSILLDAIEFALGERVPSEAVRQGQEKAEIALYFDLSTLPEAREWLKKYDLDSAEQECIIRRTINKEGRSRSFINGMPTTLQPLREFSEILLNIHGQHEHQALLKSDVQRSMLDRFAKHAHLLDQVRVLSDEWHVLAAELKQLKARSSQRNERAQFLKFQLDELEKLHLTPNEFETLDLEHKQLANSDELLQNMTHALNLLTDHEEQNALHLLHQALHALETVQHIHPKIVTSAESLKNAIIHVSDAEDELRRYFDQIEIDPERLRYVEERVSTLFDIARKHKISPQELFEFHQKISTEYTELATSDEKISELTQQLDGLEKHYHEVAHKLSQSRLKAAKKLAEQITTTIHELALPHAEFHVLFEMEDFSHPLPNGMEKVIFEIKTNIDQPLQPLAKVVSGGELSRVSLAIHLATAEQHTIPILIFDEVDVGIGGGTAEIIGKMLRKLGTSHQVLCVTHSPQVAAQGHHHLRVEKMTKDNTTYTHIQPLTQPDKIHELARMLGGVEITQTALDHAREMLEQIALATS